MNLWETRNQALLSLSGDLALDANLLDRGFQLLHYVIEKLYDVDPQTPFVRVTALIAAKANTLLACSYSLALDAHAQESGAIARVLVETVELLAYLNNEPRRIDEVLDDRLPKSGARAKAIRGHLQELRSHWNIHASHFNATYQSVAHMINFSANRLVLQQPFRAHVLRANLESLFVFLIWACLETIRCLAVATSDGQAPLREALRDLRNEGFRHFSLAEPRRSEK
jgi:hypothetical protein